MRRVPSDTVRDAQVPCHSEDELVPPGVAGRSEDEESHIVRIEFNEQNILCLYNDK